MVSAAFVRMVAKALDSREMPAEIPNLQEEDLKNLVTQAQLLRDYLLRAGEIEVRDLGALIDALAPFETASASPTTEDRKALYIAFEKVKRHSVGSVDEYTMNEVLARRSPFLHPAPLAASIAVTAIGVVLVYLAIYFTNWTNRAGHVLTEAESFASFDHFSRMSRLVEQALNYDQPIAEIASGPAQSPLDPEMVVFFERLTALKRHYIDEQSVLESLSGQIGSVNPFRGHAARLRRAFCPEPFSPDPMPPELTAFQKFLFCAEPIAFAPAPSSETASDSMADGEEKPDRQGNVQLVQSQGADGAAVTGGGGAGADVLNEFRAFIEIAQIRATEQEAMQAAGRRLFQDYSEVVQVVQTYTDRLKSNISMVSTTILPIIYGMLGSIIYCMWRILNGSVSALGFWYTLLRTAFAGLAALTLSMLILPSNILSFGFEPTRPFAYLLSFVFGYSIESLVHALNQLNHLLRPKSKDGGRPANGATGTG